MKKVQSQDVISVHDNQRFEWLDGLRGVALVLMVIYHLVWNLELWGIWDGMVEWPIFWRGWQVVTGGIFLWVVGVSLWIGYSGSKTYLAVVKRGFWLVVLGTGLSWGVQFLGLGRIDFGILQCIGVSLILTYPLMGWRRVRLGLGSLVLMLGVWGVEVPRLLVGQLDYYPLTPWWGVVLLGSVMGEILIGKGWYRRFDVVTDKMPMIGGLQFLGRHSLLVYVIHQPLLWGGYFLVLWL